MARGLKFRILEVEGLYYLGRKNKGADELRIYCKAELRLCFLHMQKAGFFHDAAHLITALFLPDNFFYNIPDGLTVIFLS